MAEIINTADLTPERIAAMNEDDQLHCYNGLDCCVTEEILQATLPMLDNISATAYAFSRELQAPVLEMMQRGLLVNQPRKHKVLREMKAKLAQLEEQLNTLIAEGIGVTGINWRSPIQLNNLLYDVMGLPEVKKRNANGIWARTSNREAIEKLSGYFIAEPLCNHIMLLRDLGKSVGFLETGLDTDGRMRSNINIAGTITGRFASSISDFGTGTNLQNVAPALRSVFVADPGYKLANVDLEQADARNLGALCWNELVGRPDWTESSAGKYLDFCECLTEDHEVLTLEGWTKISSTPKKIAHWNKGIIEFKDVIKWSQFITNKLISVESRTLSILGTENHSMPVYTGFQGHKLEKKSLREIKEAPNYQAPVTGLYREGVLHKPELVAVIAAFQADGTRDEYNKVHWTFSKQRKILALRRMLKAAGLDYSEYLLGNMTTRFYLKAGQGQNIWPKNCGKEILSWDFETLSSFCKSHFIWDAHSERENSWRIVSKNLNHLKWLATAYALTGRITSINPHKDIYHNLTIKSRNKTQYRSAKITDVFNKAEVFCPTTETGFFLVRRNNCIYVSGNSGDLHTNVAKMSNPRLPWGTAPDREIADQIAYRDKSHRFLAKTLGHGINFYGQPPTMAKHSKLPVAMVKEFQDAYFSLFPSIPAWHLSIQSALLHGAQLTTPFNRRRYFFGRPKDASTLREAIAHQPQSMTGDEINTGILRLWRANRVQLLMQVHDSILFQYPEELEDEIIPWAMEALKVHLELAKGRPFYVPVEAMTGFNWGYYNEHTNPDGLIKWRGSDTRKRQETEFKLSIKGF